MDVISRRRPSSLNPDAAPFVPWAYRTVEDFSEQWWELVKSSAWFRDYWLQECFEEPENDPDLFDIYDHVLPDIDALFDGYLQKEEKGGSREMITLGAEKWHGPRGPSDGSKYSEKVPKIVNVKVSPRTIQQPR